MRRSGRKSCFGNVSIYLPIVINLVMFLIFTIFDLEQKLPQLQKEIAERRAKQA